MALGSGPGHPLSRRFLLLGGATMVWSVLSLLLRLSLWLHTGAPLLLGELSTLACSLLAPLLLAFSSRYAGERRRWPDVVVIGSLALTAALAVPLMAGLIVGEPYALPAGATVIPLSPWGRAAGCAVAAPMALAVWILWRRPRALREPHVPLSAALLFAALVASGVLGLVHPVLSFSVAIGVCVLGWGVARRQLFDPLRERARRLELIGRVGARASAELDLDRLLDEASRLVRDAFRYYSVAILLVDGDSLVLRASTLLAPEAIGDRRLKIGAEGITGSVAATGTPALVPDVTHDRRYVSLSIDVRTRSELSVPIRLGGAIIGVLDAQSVVMDAFDEVDVFTLQTIADQLATAIGNARLYEQAARRAERLALAARISAAVGATLDLDDLMETVHREMTPVFGADAFFIALYDRDADELDYRIQVDEGMREAPGRERVGPGFTARLIRQKRPLLVRDMATELPDLPAPRLWGTGKLPISWLGAPMLLAGEVVGVICVQTYGPRRYDEGDMQLLTSLADQVAIAVGNARLYETAMRELAERERASRVLRESEEQFRNLAEQSPNMIFIFGGGRLRYANFRCEQVMGWSREEIVVAGFTWRALVSPASRPAVGAHFIRRLRGEDTGPLEVTLAPRDGQQLEAILTTSLIQAAGERAVLGILTDISARKRTERLLQALNMASLTMMQSMSPGEIFPIALGALSSLGFAAAVLLVEPGTRRIELRYAVDPQGTMGTLDPGTATLDIDGLSILRRIVDNAETVLADIEGAELWAWRAVRGQLPGLAPASGSVIFSPLHVGDEVFGVLAIEAERYGEDDLQTATAFALAAGAGWRKTTLMTELSRSLGELESTQERLLHAQKMEAIGRLAGGIAHDFNNLLTVISGYADLLAVSLDAEHAAQADVAEIKTAIHRAAALTGRLVAFSRKQPLQPAVLDLDAVVSGSVRLLGPLIGEDIELSVELEPGVGSVRADTGQLEQIIVNLAVNARDAMPSGGRLRLWTTSCEVAPGAAPPVAGLGPGRWAVLCVGDNGIGMSEEVQRHLFEPFYTTKEEGKGTGLGLSTVYGIVQQNGGTIKVTSAVGRGTRFAIYLPAVEGTPARPPEAGAEPERQRGSGTILVVEDEQTVRDLSVRVLQGAGYRTLVAGGAHEALVVSHEEPGEIDVLLTDLVLPGGLTGVDLARRLVVARPRLEVIYTSGYAPEALVSLGMPAGTARFLPKPFEPVGLLAVIARALADRAAVG